MGCLRDWELPPNLGCFEWTQQGGWPFRGPESVRLGVFSSRPETCSCPWPQRPSRRRNRRRRSRSIPLAGRRSEGDVGGAAPHVQQESARSTGHRPRVFVAFSKSNGLQPLAALASNLRAMASNLLRKKLKEGGWSRSMEYVTSGPSMFRVLHLTMSSMQEGQGLKANSCSITVRPTASKHSDCLSDPQTLQHT